MDIAIFRSYIRKQLGFLERSCAAYDHGHRDEAIRIATVLRVLLHDTRHSTSVLTRLGAKNIRILSTVDPVSFDPSAIQAGHVQYQGMVQTRIGATGVELRPGLGDRGFSRMIPVAEWWNQIVWVIGPGTALCRCDIILDAANKDGGAHVDRQLTREYEILRHEIGFQFYVSKSDGTVEHGPIQDAHLVSLRQMGYEILHSSELTSLCDS